MSKKCRFCKSEENLSRSATVKTATKVYVYYCCRRCNTENARAFRATESGKKSVARSVKKYEQNNRDRVSAWKVAAKIQKRPCEVCGDVRVHRHHPDITKPKYVIFLCPAHHKEIHSKKLTTIV